MNNTEFEEVVSVLTKEIIYAWNTLDYMCSLYPSESDRIFNECIERVTKFTNQDVNDLILKHMNR